MNMRNEKLFVSPAEFASLSDAAAIQAAVDEAARLDLRVVVIPAKADGSAWKLDQTVRISTNTTILFNGCTIETAGTAFMNSHADQPDTKSLGGEEYNLFLVGLNGAVITGTGDQPQILLSNVRNLRLAGLTFVGGAGVKLHFTRISKVQQLKFQGSKYGLYMTEGCSGLLIDDIQGETELETVIMQGGSTLLYGRDPDIRKSTLSRIQAKTSGAPAVGLYAGMVPMSTLILRDVTDLTEGEGVSVRVGEVDENSQQFVDPLAGVVLQKDPRVRDITVRGVATKRTAVETTAECDGLFCANLCGQLVEQVSNLRSRLDESTMEIALPRFAEVKPLDSFLTPNDPAFYGETDAQTIQNTIDAAAKQGKSVLIPRFNMRTQSSIWSIEKAIQLPSNITVALLAAHLRQADFCYDNLFAANDVSNITITGVGDAMLDGGVHNRLHEKTAGKFGLPAIEANAAIRMRNVSGFTVEQFLFNQTRWYAMHLTYCDNGSINNIDFSTYAFYSDLGGIYLRSGCHHITVEDITGVVSDDLVSLTGQGNDGTVEGKDMHIHHITIRNIKADSRRFDMIRLRNHDGRRIHDVVIDTLVDVSLAEQKMTPSGTVSVGSFEGYYEQPSKLGDLSDVLIRDVCSRGTAVINLGGYSANVTLDNIHTFSGTTHAIRVLGSAHVTGLKANNIFFRCDQASGYMRGTATSIITDKAKYRGCPALLTNLKGDMEINHLLTERVSIGIHLSGGASVTVNDLRVAEYGKHLTLTDTASTLTVN